MRAFPPTTLGLLRRARAARRGSAILLTIAVLSLLLLLALTISYTSRIEALSARNFSEKVADRITREAAVRRSVGDLARHWPEGPTGRLELSLDGEYLATRRASAAGRTAFSSVPNSGQRSPRPLVPYRRDGDVVVAFDDLAGRININAASEEVLAGFLHELARDTGLQINAAGIARAIAETRLGPDGAPGAANRDDDLGGVDNALLAATADPMGISGRDGMPLSPAQANALAREVRDPAGAALGRPDPERARRVAALLTHIDHPDEFIPDIRLPAFGDDVRFRTPEELLAHERIVRAGLTPAILAAARPYLTVFSTSADEHLHAGQARPAIDANRASLEEIAEALRGAFPEAGELQVRQFAANIVDARDFDRIPTMIPGERPERTVLGFERVPFLTEAYPQSRSADPDNAGGQFVEIYNPWDEPFDVSGWQLVVGGRATVLSGVVTARGYLVVTDNYDRPSAPPERRISGRGSLYDLFGVVANGLDRRVQVDSGLDLPARSGSPVVISLLDRRGNLVDFLAYEPGSGPSSSSLGLDSYQRVNPAVRSTVAARATPFAQHPSSPPAEAAARLRFSPADGPFLCRTDLLAVFAGHPGGAAASLWAFPSTNPLAAESASPFDARLMDLFHTSGWDQGGRSATARIGGRTGISPRQTARPGAVPESWAQRAAFSAADEAQRLALEEHAAFGRRPAIVHGRINLNSAPEIVLASIPGVSRTAARAIVQDRERLEREAREGAVRKGVLYASWADVAADARLMGAARTEGERIARLSELAGIVSFNSRSFLVAGQTVEAGQGGSPVRRGPLTTALVSLEDRSPVFVYWDGWRHGGQR